jgi:hypothetical protein
METILNNLRLAQDGLNSVNEQLIKYENLRQLFTDLINDQQFKASDMYLDLRVKYLTPIETIINDKTTLSMSTGTKKKTRSTATGSRGAGGAPNIYQAPSQVRKSFFGGDTKKERKVKPKSGDETPQYISFDHERKTYYISTKPETVEGQCQFTIYLQNGQSVGYLRGAKVVLEVAGEITLDSVSPLQMDGPYQRLLTNYCLV